MRALLAIALVGCTSPTSEHVAAATSCGAGTHEQAGVCVPLPPATQYTVRARRTITATPAVPVDVVVSGTLPDGTPATDEVVLLTDRPNTGTFDPPTLALDATHRRVKFTPCDAAVPGCTGPLELRMALASAPTTPIAAFPITLVAAASVGSIDHCATGGNAFYLEGSGFVQRGAVTIVDGTFTRAGGTQRGEVVVVPANPQQGKSWTFEISSVSLGTPLQPGVYRDAVFSAQPPAGKPGLRIVGENPFGACQDQPRGEFQVHEYVYTTALQRITVSFRMWCAFKPKEILSGCLHAE